MHFREGSALSRMMLTRHFMEMFDEGSLEQVKRNVGGGVTVIYVREQWK